MEDKLISSNELRKIVSRMVELPNEMRAKMMGAINRAREAVVLCKDCKHLKYGYQCYNPLGMTLNNDGDTYVIVDADCDFCSCGERRTDV